MDFPSLESASVRSEGDVADGFAPVAPLKSAGNTASLNSAAFIARHEMMLACQEQAREWHSAVASSCSVGSQ
jgi:hypothetical protein